MGRPLRRAVAGLGRPRSVDPRCALRGDHGSELPCRAHQEAAHCAPLPRRQLTARREATTVMSGVRSRHHTGSVWATPSGSRWATVDTGRTAKTSGGVAGNAAGHRDLVMATVTQIGPRLGIAPTCAALGLPRATYYRRRRPPRAAPPRRPSPRALGSGERAAVLALLHEP